MEETSQHPFYGAASRTHLDKIYGNHNLYFLFFDSSFSDLVATSSLDVRIQVYIKNPYFEGNFAKIFRFSAQNRICDSKCCFVKKILKYVILLIFKMV